MNSLRWLRFAAGLFIASGLTVCAWYVFHMKPMSAGELNAALDCSGARLLMTRPELERAAEETPDYLIGMGGYAMKFPVLQITAAFPSGGKYGNKVGSLSLSNPAHKVFGIHVGMTVEQAGAELQKHRFKRVYQAENRYESGALRIDFYTETDSPVIRMIRVGIEDPAQSGKIY